MCIEIVVLKTLCVIGKVYPQDNEAQAWKRLLEE